MRRTKVLASLATTAAAVAGGLGTEPDTRWYRRLRKPSWQPPPQAFPVVWTPLYAGIAYGTGRMLDAERDPSTRRRLWALVAADLAANAGWCWVFFKRRSPAGGVAVIAALDGLNLVLLREAARRDSRAAVALAPYVVWTGFATALNTSIWRLNR